MTIRVTADAAATANPEPMLKTARTSVMFLDAAAETADQSSAALGTGRDAEP